MKPDDDPWQHLVALPEPKLAPDFARRVLRQAQMRRWRRQFRRRLIAACVFSAALGFVGTTVIRVRLAQKNTPPQHRGAVTRSAAAAPKSALKPSHGLTESPESPAIDNFVLSGRLGDDSVSADDAATGNTRASGKLPIDSSAPQASQTLVLKAPPTSEERATGALDATVPADPPQPSPPRSPPEESAGLPNAGDAADAPDAAGAQQPAIHLP